jgi:hypothetical protein
MQVLRAATVDEPLLAHHPQGTAAFWFVPLLSGTRVCGFARVELDGRVAQVASFGAGPRDTAAWLEADFFRRPPQHLLEAVRSRHPGLPIGAPVFGYDGSPARWAWRVLVGQPASSVAYITPGGWYERPVERGRPVPR